MKRLLLSLCIVLVALWAGWQNRVDLVVWAAPKISHITNPVAENRPLAWQRQTSSSETDSGENTPPNIILIMTDDLGFNDISLYNGGAGDGQLQTPHIDALAHEGVRFNNGYAANAVCAPSRASTMTGRYSTRFGFEYTPIFKLGPTLFRWMQELTPPPKPILFDQAAVEAMPSIEQLGMPGEEITIAEVLQQRGYYTAHIGKWHLGSVGDMQPHKQGFDDSLHMEGALYLPKDSSAVVNAMVESDPIDRMIWATGRYAASFNGSEHFEPDGYLTDYYTDQAVEVINNNHQRPFFLYLAHWGIHNPLQAAREDYEALAHIKDHKLRVYSAMIRAVDRSVERVVAALKAHQLEDNTLIIFTSDNGGAGYIDLPDINHPYRGWKLTHFEGGTHVPYLMKWPKQIPAGTVYDKPVHHIDLFHTLAAAAGAEIPKDRKLDGVDLTPFVRGEKPGQPHDTLFWREAINRRYCTKAGNSFAPSNRIIRQPKRNFCFILHKTRRNR